MKGDMGRNESPGGQGDCMKPYYSNAGIMIYNAHVLDALQAMDAESVQCVVTSPPYWGLRDYGIEGQVWGDSGDCGHEWDEQILKGEARLNEAISNMENSASPRKTNPEAFQKVEHKHAFCLHCSAWKGSLGLEPTPELFIQHIVQVFREVKRVLRKDGTVWLNLGDSYTSGNRPDRDPATISGSGLKNRSYGMDRPKTPLGLKPKDLCGIPWRVALALQADGWWLRSDIIWHKPNPMPESVMDRPTRSHEYIFLLTKASKYYYDNDAIREPQTGNAHSRGSEKGNEAYQKARGSYFNWKSPNVEVLGGRNKRTVWIIPTQSFPEAHFATFPEDLVKPCILAGSKAEDTVLDPFNGSGQTLYIAKKLNRKGLGIDIKEEYCKMAVKRLAQEVLPFK